MANKPAQLLTIEPANELKFMGPFCTAVSSFMRLTNPTDHNILFKIKTTAPKKYCVRPNCGLLEPKSTIEITIILQPFIFDATEKNKHKFMVQSMIMPEGDVSPEQLWKDVSPDELMDSKLRCVFELPVDNQSSATSAQGTGLPVSSAAVSQSMSATPNRNESGLASMEPQHAGNLNNDEEKLSDSRLVQELKKLREAESELRHENLLLKERILRMRMDADNIDKEAQQQSLSSGSSGIGSSLAAGSGSSGAAAAAQYQNLYSPPQLANQQQIPIMFVVAAIAMAVFGLILGKFVL
ncbi:vesicle-associated membrane protein/synaptobrevin-binding protein-like [Wyeomyia smithii]|uniref:vesicle-associated membrane protein/synaptobrevin-binding protein-like n=1 Tax=Wyeomyia smithii TaxID=174621 RepID=UPI002467D24C|nr:vesicle-associated membrane protein/synaptobrevin-binding protein-like [Wyeomyia smithii]